WNSADAPGHALLETADGAIVVVGATDTGGPDGVDVVLMVANTDGTPLAGWPKAYGGINAQQAFDVVETPEGGYLIAGQTDTGSANGVDAYLLKVDDSGKVRWEQAFGGAGEARANAVVALRDAGFAFAGRSDSPGTHGGTDAYIVTVDANGQNPVTSWYGGAGDEEAFGLIEASDGTLVVVGDTATSGGKSVNAFVLKLNTDLAEVSSMAVGGAGTDGARGVVEATDGAYVVVGATTSQGAGLSDAYIFKIDADLTSVLWEQVFGTENNDFGAAIAPSVDGGYVLTGSTDAGDGSGVDVLIVKTDDAGVASLNSAVGGAGADSGNAVIETSGGAIGVAGRGAASAGVK
ncbi:MAG: hypothetical protein L3K26_10455, partial [Candidatus Hydrogenedentes bacterium]|nr:hypothetical protein [Candidatus Hydrogenedentota bacterium]